MDQPNRNDDDNARRWLMQQIPGPSKPSRQNEYNRNNNNNNNNRGRGRGRGTLWPPKQPQQQRWNQKSKNDNAKRGRKRTWDEENADNLAAMLGEQDFDANEEDQDQADENIDENDNGVDEAFRADWHGYASSRREKQREQHEDNVEYHRIVSRLLRRHPRLFAEFRALLTEKMTQDFGLGDLAQKSIYETIDERVGKILNQLYFAPDHDPIKKLFKGVSIYVNGYTYPTAGTLRTLMQMSGGEFSWNFDSRRTTHTISTVLSTAQKRQERARLTTVRPEWILDSFDARKLLDLHDYKVAKPRNHDIKRMFAAIFARQQQQQREQKSAKRPKIAEEEEEEEEERNCNLEKFPANKITEKITKIITKRKESEQFSTELLLDNDSLDNDEVNNNNNNNINNNRLKSSSSGVDYREESPEMITLFSDDSLDQLFAPFDSTEIAQTSTPNSRPAISHDDKKEEEEEEKEDDQISVDKNSNEEIFAFSADSFSSQPPLRTKVALQEKEQDDGVSSQSDDLQQLFADLAATPPPPPPPPIPPPSASTLEDGDEELGAKIETEPERMSPELAKLFEEIETTTASENDKNVDKAKVESAVTREEEAPKQQQQQQNEENSKSLLKITRLPVPILGDARFLKNPPKVITKTTLNLDAFKRNPTPGPSTSSAAAASSSTNVHSFTGINYRFYRPPPNNSKKNRISKRPVPQDSHYVPVEAYIPSTMTDVDAEMLAQLPDEIRHEITGYIRQKAFADAKAGQSSASTTTIGPSTSASTSTAKISVTKKSSTISKNSKSKLAKSKAEAAAAAAAKTSSNKKSMQLQIDKMFRKQTKYAQMMANRTPEQKALDLYHGKYDRKLGANLCGKTSARSTVRFLREWILTEPNLDDNDITYVLKYFSALIDTRQYSTLFAALRQMKRTISQRAAAAKLEIDSWKTLFFETFPTFFGGEPEIRHLIPSNLFSDNQICSKPENEKRISSTNRS